MWSRSPVKVGSLVSGDVVEMSDNNWRVTDVRFIGEYVDVYGFVVDDDAFTVDDTEEAFIVHMHHTEPVTLIDI